MQLVINSDIDKVREEDAENGSRQYKYEPDRGDSCFGVFSCRFDDIAPSIGSERIVREGEETSGFLLVNGLHQKTAALNSSSMPLGVRLEA
jgi:hypothetical protein